MCRNGAGCHQHVETVSRKPATACMSKHAPQLLLSTGTDSSSWFQHPQLTDWRSQKHALQHPGRSSGHQALRQAEQAGQVGGAGGDVDVRIAQALRGRRRHGLVLSMTGSRGSGIQ